MKYSHYEYYWVEDKFIDPFNFNEFLGYKIVFNGHMFPNKREADRAYKKFLKYCKTEGKLTPEGKKLFSKKN
jgi:hypothetical protein